MKGYFSYKVSHSLVLIIVYSYRFSQHSPLSQILQTRIKHYFVPLISHCTLLLSLFWHTTLYLNYTHVPIYLCSVLDSIKKVFEDTICLLPFLYFLQNLVPFLTQKTYSIISPDSVNL